jgi:outer membrane protein OmpA-like peptidoglycan-associated protein
MNLSQILSPALAAALVCAGCGASSRSTPDQTEEQLEAARHDAREAREEASEARQDAARARQDAHAATAAERDAELQAQSATQRAAQADAQWRATHPGSAERQADNGDSVAIVKGGLLFPPNTVDLPLDIQAKLDQVAANLRDQSAHHVIVIDGYSDDSGPEPLNVQLSRQRADRVAAYLMTRGVPRDRVVVRGLGSVNPVSRDETEGGRALNRRVEISVRPADR